jgi:hypothetical protein
MCFAATEEGEEGEEEKRPDSRWKLNVYIHLFELYGTEVSLLHT